MKRNYQLKITIIQRPRITVIKQNNKGALKGDKILNLPFVCPELVFWKREVGIKTEGGFVFCQNMNVISGHKQTVVKKGSFSGIKSK